MSEFLFLKDFKNRRIKLRFKEDIEPQEVFLDALAQKKEAEFFMPGKRLELPLPRRILKGFLIFSIILILFLLGKTFQFQVIENKKFVALAQNNKYIIHSLQAIRGVVYDSKGEQLIFNKISFDLIVNKNKLSQLQSDREKILQGVAGIIKKQPKILEEEINAAEGPTVLISENLDHQTLILLETKIKEFPGFEIKQNAVREYKEGETFAHLIGYTGKIGAEEFKQDKENYSIFDYIGRTGLEKSYEEILRKKPGKLQIEKDATGKEISTKIVSLPKPGDSLVLWLDSELQRKIESELEKILKKTETEAGAAVAIDPKTGGILALVSLPTFDNNLFSPGADPDLLTKLLSEKGQPLFNRAVSGQYPTGSIIKPLEAAAALEENLISAAKKINCQGKISIPHQYNPEIVYEYHDWSTHGPTDMRKALAESCSVYFYIIGGGYENQKGLGPSRIKKYVELFGWGNKTGIDLPNESNGFVPSPEWKREVKKEGWWDGDTYNLSIGQGDIKITPLQVASSFVAIANGGTLYQPQIAHKIIDSDKNVIEEFGPKILRQNFIDPKYLEVVREGMRHSVSGEGSPQATALILNSLPVKAAAKTGTAQISRPDYYDKWVTVFAPYDDPQIVLTVIVESAEYEELTSTGVAKEVLEWYFNRQK